MRPTTAARYGRHAAHTDTLGSLAALGCLASVVLLVWAVVWLFVKLTFYVVVVCPYLFVKYLIEGRHSGQQK